MPIKRMLFKKKVETLPNIRITYEERYDINLYIDIYDVLVRVQVD